MPDPEARAPTGGRLLDRATGDKAETAIGELLRMRFSDPDDPRVLARRDALHREFAKVPVDRAASLLSRLANPRPGDELASGFQRLTQSTQNALKNILADRAATYRAILDPVQAQQALRKAQASDPRYRPDFIDNLHDAVGFNGVLLTVSLYWDDSGQRRLVTVPTREIALQPVRSFWHDERIYDSQDAALHAVERLRSKLGNSVDAVFGYYTGPYGVVMPTLFCNESAPRILKLLLGVMRDYYADMVTGWNILANAVNPVPATSVDERGRLHFDLNISTVALALLALFHLKSGAPRSGPSMGKGPGVRVTVTPNEAAAIGELQATLAKRGRWTDLPRTSRALLGNLFHKTVESLSEFIYRGIGPVHKRVKVTPDLIKQQRATGGRILLVEGQLPSGKGTIRVDLAEVDFAAKRVVVLDLTSVDRAAHVAKTRGYASALAELTGFPASAIEFRYVGEEGTLLRTLAEALLSEVGPKTPR
jgi:hypothetical protein